MSQKSKQKKNPLPESAHALKCIEAFLNMTADEVKSILQNANQLLSESDFAEMESFAESSAKTMLAMIRGNGGSMMRFALINVMALATLSHLMHCTLEGIDPSIIQELDDVFHNIDDSNKESIN